jgi:hypothetical protein
MRVNKMAPNNAENGVKVPFISEPIERSRVFRVIDAAESS